MVLRISLTDNRGIKVGPSTYRRDLKELAKFSQEITFKIAQEVLIEEQKAGFDKKPRVRTDNTFDKSPKLVNPFGKIEYYAKQEYAPALIAIYQRLLDLSRVGRTGFYKSSHVVFFRGNMVAENQAQFLIWLKGAVFKDGDKLRFINLMPYARKLELNANRNVISGSKKGAKRGKKRYSVNKKRVQVRQPNGTYFNTYRFANNKYKSLFGFISFSLITGDSIGLGNTPYRSGFGTRYTSRKFKGKGATGRSYLYPSIVFSFSETGANQGVLQ